MESKKIRRQQGGCCQRHFHLREGLGAFWIRSFKVTFLPLFIFLALASSALAENYQVEGDFNYQVFDQDGNVTVHLHRTFKVAVTGCNWSASTAPAELDETYPVMSYEARTDGTNVYSSSIFNLKYDQAKGLAALIKSMKWDTNAMLAKATSPEDKKLIQSMFEPAPSARRNDAVGKIMRGTTPQYGFDLIGPCWMAFGSGCYFDTVKTNRAPRMSPYDYPKQMMDDPLVPGTWQISPEAPHLPVRVTLQHSGLHYARNADGYKSTPFVAPYNLGFTNILYEVLSSTNIGGLVFPQSFRMTDYFPCKGVTDDKTLLKTVALIEGRVTRIQLGTFAGGPVRVPVNTVVEDMRFKYQGYNKMRTSNENARLYPPGLHYLAQSNQFLGGTNINELTRLDRAARLSEKKRQSNIKLVSSATLAILLIGFVIMARAVIKRKLGKPEKN